MILQPGEFFTIVRGIPDPSDSTQYYVQAVIRNAATDAVLATVNLVDKGNHRRYSKAWQVPVAGTEAGLYITVVTSVYTDVGYTTPSPLYGDDYETYLIQERWSRALMNSFFLGMSGTDIDYKRIEKLLKEAIEKIPAAPEAKEVNLTPVLAALGQVHSRIEHIVIPEPKETSLEPVLTQIATLHQSLQTLLNAPPPKETDLNPVLSALQSVSQPHIANVAQAVDGLFARIKEFFQSDIAAIQAEIAKTNKKIDQLPYVVVPGKEPEKPTKKLTARLL